MSQTSIDAAIAGSRWGGWTGMLGKPRLLLRDVAIGGALAIWIAVLGPFGSFHAGPLATRALYFVSLTPPCLLLYGPAVRLAGRLGQRFDVSLWLTIPIAIMLASGPFSVLVYVVAPRFFPQLHGRATLVEAYLETLILMLPGAGAFAIGDLVFARWRSWRSAASAPPQPRQTPTPGEIDGSPLLLGCMGGDVVAVRAETTMSGSTRRSARI